MAEQASDVAALVAAMTPTQLATLLAKIIRNQGEGKLVVDPAQIDRDLPVVTSVAKNPDGSLEIGARDPRRPTGYYLVYDANLVRDVVAYWDDAKGEWLASHVENSPSAGLTGAVAVVQPITMPST